MSGLLLRFTSYCLAAGILGIVPIGFAQLKELPEVKEGATEPPPLTRPVAEPVPGHEGLVDEDEDLLPQTEYAFNPIQAKKELKVGHFYRKKNNYRAAAARFLEAGRWDPSLAEAFWELGQARDELKQPAEALAAYERFVALAPDDKNADKAKQRIQEIEATLDSPPLAAADAETDASESTGP